LHTHLCRSQDLSTADSQGRFRVHPGFFVVRSTPWAKDFLQQWLDRQRLATSTAVRAAWDALWGDDGGATGAVVAAVTSQLLHANSSIACDAAACMRSVYGGEEEAGASSLKVDAAAVAACVREQLQACGAPLAEPRSVSPLCLPPVGSSDQRYVSPTGRYRVGDFLWQSGETGPRPPDGLDVVCRAVRERRRGVVGSLSGGKASGKVDGRRTADAAAVVPDRATAAAATETGATVKGGAAAAAAVLHSLRTGEVHAARGRMKATAHVDHRRGHERRDRRSGAAAEARRKESAGALGAEEHHAYASSVLAVQ